MNAWRSIALTTQWKIADLFSFAAGNPPAKEIFSGKLKNAVDILVRSGYNNQAVFSREQTFAAVLELVDRPA